MTMGRQDDRGLLREDGGVRRRMSDSAEHPYSAASTPRSSDRQSGSGAGERADSSSGLRLNMRRLRGGDADEMMAMEDAGADGAGLDFFPCFTPSQLRHRFIQIHVIDQRFKEPSWMHPNIGGEAQYIKSSAEELENLKQEMKERQHNLGQWMSTAISGNDVLSSVLFSAGLTIAKSGKLAPLAQLIVLGVVYGLRWVLGEVMSAVPLNGGCYNAILNASSKKVAAMAATFSILCYLATGVVCAVSAVNYVNHSLVSLPVVGCTVAMLFGFAVLCLFGIAESAMVAFAFLSIHTFTLTVLCVCSLIYFVRNPSVLWDNLHTPLPSVLLFGDSMVDGNFVLSLFLGYGPAALSVTGFEASAQFVEQQAPGVYPKTLRNMWALSTFNVIVTFLALAVVPIPEIMENKEVLLAYMGRVSSGHWLEVMVTIDAFIVLAGAVLTSYVGINGLLQRLAIDRVLPRFLLRQNEWRGTNHFIILSYFFVASSLVIALNGRVDTLSGVFAFAFLGVLSAFTVGCMLLKVQREEIPRETTTSWGNAAFCLVMLLIGMAANAVGDVSSLGYFAIYYFGVLLIIFAMLERVGILKAMLYVSKQWIIYFKYKRAGRDLPPMPRQHALATAPPTTTNARGQGVIGSVFIAKTIEAIKKTPVIFFCKSPNLPKINEAISYVIHNEQTYCLRLVHVVSPTGADEVPREFEDIVCLFDHIYPSIKIDFVAVTGVFDPSMIEWISRSMKIPTNMMFMRQPASTDTHKVAAVGVRVITN